MWKHQNPRFCDWLIAFTIITIRLIHLVACQWSPSFLKVKYSTVCYLFNYTSVDIWYCFYLCLLGGTVLWLWVDTYFSKALPSILLEHISWNTHLDYIVVKTKVVFFLKPHKSPPDGYEVLIYLCFTVDQLEIKISPPLVRTRGGGYKWDSLHWES